jgi:choline dehydrogenase-like flavoprotein
LGDKPTAEQDYGLNLPGEIIHEVGTVRMGSDPKTSALNKWQQAHDVKNLFVVDAGPFVSQGDKNCTWTILALSMRASRHIVTERKAGKL